MTRALSTPIADWQALHKPQRPRDTRGPAEAIQIDWSPRTLRTLLAEQLPGAQVIVVSNRQPYIHNRLSDGRLELQVPASGLVTALEPIMRTCGGTWIAHGSGTADRETVDCDDHVRVPPRSPSYTLRRVWISDEEQDGYYFGLANEAIWPLSHIAFVRPTFRQSDWLAYKTINQRFAETVVAEATCDDPIVLVQDYHFALVPRLVRERLPKATILTFWHIPWPNAETFGICPWKTEIVEGLLGSTILGFHTRSHCHNFLDTVDRCVESRSDREQSSVTFGGRETKVRPYPISIEWPPEAVIGQRPIGMARAIVRARLALPPDTRLAVGAERFDYTKGILERLNAVDDLLTRHPEWHGRFAFVQALAPTRSKLTSYQTLQRDAIELAEAINGRHASNSFKPVHLSIRHHEPAEVFELMRAADVCLVTSLQDGMNLVAKEFVGARDDERGVLVLSSFAGAADELAEALIVNPYDTAETGEAIHRALIMPGSEQRERMGLMRAHVRQHNVYRWAGRMLLDAAGLRRRQRIADLEDEHCRSR